MGLEEGGAVSWEGSPSRYCLPCAPMSHAELPLLLPLSPRPGFTSHGSAAF